MSKNRALLVGINYPGSDHQLRGCVNDVLAMKELIVNNFGFTNSADVRLLLDNDATTVNIKNHLEWLVGGSSAGDVLFFHFSGHGSQLPDNNDSDYEVDGLDEIICPVDLDWRQNVIRDDDLKRIFDKVPAGVCLTVILDCCNSGGALDQHNQYQPLGIGEARKIYEGEEFISRYIPMPEYLIEQVRSRGIRTNKNRTNLARTVQDRGMLITGCQSHQTSADAWIGGKYMGAATYYIIQTLNEAKHDIDYKKLIDDVNNKIADAGYSQRPELNGNPLWFTSKVLRPITEEVSSTDSIDTNNADMNDNFIVKFFKAIVRFFKKLFGG